jgi:hypothetical protein
MSILWVEAADLLLARDGMDDHLPRCRLHHLPLGLDETLRGPGDVESSSEVSTMTAPQRKTVATNRRKRRARECWVAWHEFEEPCVFRSVHNASTNLRRLKAMWGGLESDVKVTFIRVREVRKGGAA